MMSLMNATNMEVFFTYTWTRTRRRAMFMSSAPVYLQPWPQSVHYMGDFMQVMCMLVYEYLSLKAKFKVHFHTSNTLCLLC